MAVVEFLGRHTRREVFPFPEGKVTIEMNDGEAPLDVKTAIYFLSNVLHQIHRMMEPGE